MTLWSMVLVSMLLEVGTRRDTSNALTGAAEKMTQLISNLV